MSNTHISIGSWDDDTLNAPGTDEHGLAICFPVGNNFVQLAYDHRGAKYYIRGRKNNLTRSWTEIG